MDVVTPAECVEKVGTVSPAPLAAAVSFTDTLPKQLQGTHSTGFASYAVEVENTHGRSAGLSNQVIVPLAPTLPPPRHLFARVTADGVSITAYDAFALGIFGAKAAAYHLYRRTQGAQQYIDLGDSSGMSVDGQTGTLFFLDRTAEWEKTYLYKIAAVTTELLQGKDERIEGDDSPEIEVFVHDIFPPSVPTGLEAVSSGTPPQPFIDLTWAPNTESDLAGYNAYRHEEGAEPKKINGELVKGPTYRDSAVQAGHRYSYSVTAVDLRGNEGGKNPAAASETVPR